MTLTRADAARVGAALALIARTPGYESAGDDLAARWRGGRIRFDPALPDRAQTTLTGVILLGPEAMEGSTLGLAQTLVHEQYHLHQNPLEKTVSFWSGVASHRPVMARYERPAYRAALRFIDAVAAAFPEMAEQARYESHAVAAVFAACYDQQPLI